LNQREIPFKVIPKKEIVPNYVNVALELPRTILEMGCFFLNDGYSKYCLINPPRNDDVLDGTHSLMKSVQDYTRFPLLLSGVGELVEGYPKIIENSSSQTLISLFVIFTAASMYINSSDTKILEKKPSHKRAIDSVKEKLLTPEPQPIPATNNYTPAFQTNVGLTDRVKGYLTNTTQRIQHVTAMLG
jgi:hypothetical protein